MKGVRFYEELENKNRKGERSKGNVTAVFHENGFFTPDSNGRAQYVFEALGAVQDYPDCPVASTSVSPDWLSENTRRIPEKRAREIHPQLFVFLDASED